MQQWWNSKAYFIVFLIALFTSQTEGQGFANYELNIGGKPAIPSSVKPVAEYELMEEQDPLEFESIVMFPAIDLQNSVSECQLNPARAQGPFVQVQGGQFFYNGQPFYFMGMNSYHLVKIEKNATYFSLDFTEVDTTFQTAAELGIQVVRLWSFSDDIRPNPTSWDDRTFQALDSIIAKADKYGLKVVLAFANYWEQFNGTDSYISMVRGTIKGYTIEDFYADEDVKLLYKAHVCKVISRVNSVTGVMYRDDPAILGWNLMNEPRCINCRGRDAHSGVLGGLLREWVDEMASFVKSIDPNHLLTTGSEGFFGHASSQDALSVNPDAWGQCIGTDFTLIHDTPDIDYAVLHVYPQHKGYNYLLDGYCDVECMLDWVVVYIQKHFEEGANILGKPVVVEEFGVSVNEEYRTLAGEQVTFSERDRVELYKRVLGVFLQSASTGGGGGGIMLWTAAVNNYKDYDGFTVYLDWKDFEFETVQEFQDIPDIPILDVFRKTLEIKPCSEEEYQNGFRVTPVTSLPPIAPLTGSNEVVLLQEAASQLEELGVKVDFTDKTLSDVVDQTPALPGATDIDPSIISVIPFSTPVGTAGCGAKLSNSVLVGEILTLVTQNTFEECCEACQNYEGCNVFEFCEDMFGCFDQGAFRPFSYCAIKYQEALEVNGDPEVLYEGEATQLVAGYV